MNMIEHEYAKVPLPQLQQWLEPAAFDGILLERLRAGRAEEVAAFFAGVAGQKWLERRDAPWAADRETWLAIARLAVPLGKLPAGGSEAWRSCELSREMQTLARAWLAGLTAVQSASGKTCDFFCNLYRWFFYKEMPSEEAAALIVWAVEVRVLARRDMSFSRYGMQPAAREWEQLLPCLSDADMLALAAHGGILFADILDAYRARHRREPASQCWAPWHDFFGRHPDLYDLYPVEDDAELIARQWELSADQERRQRLARTLIKKCEQPDFLVVFDRLVRQAPASFVQALRDDWGASIFSPEIAGKIWSEQYPALLPLLLPCIAQQHDLKPYLPLLRALLQARPQSVEEMVPARLAKLLPRLETGLLKAMLAPLGQVLASSSSKVLREAMVALAWKVGANEIAAAGWVKVRSPHMALTCRDLLLRNLSQAMAGPLLVELLAGGNLDAAAADILEAQLRQRGLLAEDAAPLTLSALEARAAEIGSTRGIAQYDSPDVLTLLAPLSEHAGRVVLHLAATAERELPPLALKLLAEVPEAGRAGLASWLVDAWIAREGDPQHSWVLKLVPGNADDRVVDPLAAAVLAWGRSLKQRALLAVQQLAALDSLYALARLHELSSARKLRGMVLGAVRLALEDAARRRLIPLSELLDELSPDFGLAAGVALTVGPDVYRVELQGDLSLRVVNAKGKALKRLPVLKDAALRPEWEVANARLKELASGLRRVLKQQRPRLQEALMTGKSWPLVRWRRLFLEHPLLRIVGRSLIWRVDGTPLSFRIAEDFSLIDVDDDPLSLPEESAISLWHPASALPGEAEAWQGYLADYELIPLVEQIGAPAQLPVPEQFEEDALLPPAELVMTQGELTSLLAKWNYRAGPVGEKGCISRHDLELPTARMRVELHHDLCMPYYLSNRIEIQHMKVYGEVSWRAVPPAELPRPLLATLAAQLQALADKAALYERK